jgi:hypothetical protein
VYVLPPHAHDVSLPLFLSLSLFLSPLTCLLSYTDLSHEDKEKDRAIVRVAIKEYDRFMADLYQKIIIAASQSNILTSAVGTMFRKFRRASSFGPMSGLSAVAAALQEEEKAEDIDTAAFATELAKIIESVSFVCCVFSMPTCPLAHPMPFARTPTPTLTLAHTHSCAKQERSATRLACSN